MLLSHIDHTDQVFAVPCSVSNQIWRIGNTAKVVAIVMSLVSLGLLRVTREAFHYLCS